MSTTSSAGFLVELKLPEGLTPDHMQEYVADLYRLRISRPSNTTYGFFWDHDLRAIAFFPKPTLPISASSCATVSSTMSSTVVDRMAPVFAQSSTISRSGQTRVSSAEFYNNAIRYIKMKSAYSGRLHSVGVGTGLQNPTEQCPISQLVVDTGSSTTWIYGADAKITGTTRPLPRAPRSCAYYSGADRLQPPARGILEYISTDKLQIELYRGPFFLMGQNLNKCVAKSFTFGVGMSTSATIGVKEMDGILAMGLVKAAPIEQVQPDLFIEALRAGGHINTQRFTIALGRSIAQKSFMVIGDPTPSLTAVLRSWTPWVATVSRTSWAIHLCSIKIAGETYRVAENVILDTGTAFSYLPQETIDWLLVKLGGKLDQHGVPIFPQVPDPASRAVTFEFDNMGYIELDIRWILDGRNAPERINGQLASKSMFKAGKSTSANEETMYFLGNYFFRGLVVEFERLMSSSPGRIRIGFRHRDL
ncbi:aspartic peptidase domain-containing protein [Mycena crocata]|nr:aspartic peptidase domain-containing protein [Mycena crocata]